MCGREEPNAHDSCAGLRWALASARETKTIWALFASSSRRRSGSRRTRPPLGLLSVLLADARWPFPSAVILADARWPFPSAVILADARWPFPSAVILADARNQTRTTRALASDGPSRPQGRRRLVEQAAAAPRRESLVET